MDETITLHNTSASLLDLHFFQYSDFDLTTLGASDTVALVGNPLTGFTGAVQSHGGFAMSETSISPPANHGQAALYPDLLDLLNDSSPTTLNDNPTAGPGDANFALQWDITLAPGATFTIQKQKIIVVPEPATSGLVCFGLIAAVCQWTKRKRP
jgi:hypothetical protein